jgi:DNA-binding MarR family transcriptional regulator
MTEKNDFNKQSMPNFSKVDKFIHQSSRLRLISLLYVIEEADYVFLKNQTGLTWGNLSSHMEKLEEKGYIDVKKEFKQKKPHTTAKLNKKGRKAFEQYRKKIKRMLKEVDSETDRNIR